MGLQEVNKICNGCGPAFMHLEMASVEEKICQKALIQRWRVMHCSFALGLYTFMPYYTLFIKLQLGFWAGCCSIWKDSLLKNRESYPAPSRACTNNVTDSTRGGPFIDRSMTHLQIVIDNNFYSLFYSHWQATESIGIQRSYDFTSCWGSGL